MRKASIHRLKDKYKSQLTRGRQPLSGAAAAASSDAPESGPGETATKPSQVIVSSTRANIVRNVGNLTGGASDYYSKFKNRNKVQPEPVPSSTRETVVSSETRYPISRGGSKASTTDSEIMHLSPSSENVSSNFKAEDDYEEDDDYENEEEGTLTKQKMESTPSTTSRSTTTEPPVSFTIPAIIPTVPTTGTTLESGPSFVPTRISTTTSEKIAPKLMEVKPTVPAPASEPNIKDLLRSGKLGNDPAKIKDMLDQMKNKPEAAATSPDQEEVDPKNIFKKYADLAKNKNPVEKEVINNSFKS
jgi:hypothetical protein